MNHDENKIKIHEIEATNLRVNGYAQLQGVSTSNIYSQYISSNEYRINGNNENLVDTIRKLGDEISNLRYEVSMLKANNMNDKIMFENFLRFLVTKEVIDDQNEFREYLESLRLADKLVESGRR